MLRCKVISAKVNLLTKKLGQGQVKPMGKFGALVVAWVAGASWRI
jgi:hypothetical protein